MKFRSLGHNLSVYLDLLRLVAALAVFLAHSNTLLLHIDTPGISFLLGQSGPAVAVFFVLSGFMMSYVVSVKERDAYSYITARAARLYSVVLLAIVVTYVADAIGLSLNPAYYATDPKVSSFFQPFSWTGLVSYLTFTNQLWFTHGVLGTNEPYWSLGFEVPYYVLFGLFVFLPRRTIPIAICIWLAFYGPKIVMYFPVWLTGVALHRVIASDRKALTPVAAGFLFAATLMAYVLLARYLMPHATSMFSTFGIRQEIFNFVFFSLVGGVVALNILAFSDFLGEKPVWNPKVVKAVRWLAGASFTLYLMHLPLIILFSSMSNASSRPLMMGVLSCIVTLAIILVLAEFGERRKAGYARIVKSLVPKWRPLMVDGSQKDAKARS